ncbi:MAG TPA: Crp/Fnr family transcriptional regulator [Acidimicrobiia bacterium]|nr:Crp/Fnr family transcriptional regulator [Acidimicrobiia bacterium]
MDLGAASASPFARTAASVRSAFEMSHLGSLPIATKDRLVSSATLLTVPAGSTLHRERDEAAHLELVVSGLLRAYVTALDGRTLTVRYCRAGSLLGAVSLFSSPFSMPASVQAVTNAEVLSMSALFVKQAVDRDVILARALIDELADRVMSFIAEIPGSAFATVRQRVARHLLDLASATQTRSELRATISQQELADAVGSVREAVVRVLRELREERLVKTGREGITLLNPEKLSAEAYPGPAGTNVPYR